MSWYKKRVLYLHLAVLLLVGLGAAGVYFFGVKNSPSIKIPPDPDLTPEQIAIRERLLNAPWMGVRYLYNSKEWRFYAITGETQQIEMVHTFNLVKLYYLLGNGRMSFTWGATSVDRSSPQNLVLAASPLSPGTLVSVSLRGDNVSSGGVDWKACDSFYCRVAQTVDTILILDDQGTGISNGFIRYGWQPPSSPMYGFLCWYIDPVDISGSIIGPASGIQESSVE